MGRAISPDMRMRMVRGIASGKSRRAVAGQFEVAPSTAVRIQARFAATGSVEPARQGRPTGSGKLGPYRACILAKVEAQPDITMPDLAAWLEAEHDVTVDPSNLSKLLCREGFTYKDTAGRGKQLLRKAKARTYDALCGAIGDICNLFDPQECRNYLKDVGYVQINRPML